MVSHSLLQWTTFCQTSSPWPVCLGWPRTAWLSFIELDTAVVLGSDWLVFWDYGFSVPALWCPLATPAYLGFSDLGCGVSLYGCSNKAQPLLLTLEEGYLLMAAPPDLEGEVAPLGPPAPVQPPFLGRGVAPLGSHESRKIGSGQTGDGKSECRHSRYQLTKMHWNGWI